MAHAQLAIYTLQNGKNSADSIYSLFGLYVHVIQGCTITKYVRSVLEYGVTVALCNVWHTNCLQDCSGAIFSNDHTHQEASTTATPTKSCNCDI